MSFMEEIMKIPPVTRWFYVQSAVFRDFELWRLPTSFFLGSVGLQYLFDLITLYRTSEQIESSYYTRRSADYAWQLIGAAAAIFALNIPLGSFLHSRPFLICLVYMSARLAPPLTQTSLFGLVTMPITWYPYVLIAFDLIMGGHRVAASSVTGAVVGHLWWWGVWEARTVERYGAAPMWLRGFISHSQASGSTGGSGASFASGSGVRVVPPRRPLGGLGGQDAPPPTAAAATGHAWGSGQRLG
ncbi:hypothetical protein EUX98_g6084 [Antrodiella citrinella]|uniref:Derlin n=1 Tax=Antrodiella citrinella TaxID=2447956 RepID=A0A4S4MPV2_9APHY|nr:hypothetical protein EUX98_g6084 [Antrodiella citrinella]